MSFKSPDHIRKDFAAQMSVMFQSEVPAYSKLVTLVRNVNKTVLDADPTLLNNLVATDGLDRLDEERHGAIRLGTPDELATIRRLFAVMGMYPVGYYDLTAAAVPVHSTAFRPLRATSLAISPFRVFTSLLRLDLIEDADLRTQAQNTLSARQIYTPRTLELIEKAEKDGGLDAGNAQEFISQALETFRWHADAQVTQALFEKLLDAHRLIADVVSFKGPHINHLTPRILDIDKAQRQMPLCGINPKAVVEGPPPRRCQILLRQTSFKALSEKIEFLNDDGVEGTHTARFGEIEQRGAALTAKGRALYDRLLDQCRQEITPAPDGSNAKSYNETLSRVFEAFPDDWETMRKKGLAYFQYFFTRSKRPTAPAPLDEWIDAGWVGYAPIIYEDFLPVSAAGIFQSNLGDAAQKSVQKSPNREMFIQALGATPKDELALYEELEDASIKTLHPLYR